MEGLRPFVRYFDFKGRSSRAEFWQFMAYVWAAGFLLFVLEEAFDINLSILAIPFILATFVPQISVAVRRFHDFGASGWWLALLNLLGATASVMAINYEGSSKFLGTKLILVPYFAAGYVLYLMTTKGDEGPNKFGPPDSEAAEYDTETTAEFEASSLTDMPITVGNIAASDSRLDHIERLASLHERGVLTDEEYAVEKAKALG